MEEIQNGIEKADADMKKIMIEAQAEVSTILAELTRQIQGNPDPAAKSLLERRFGFATMTQEQLDESEPFKAEVVFLPMDLKQIAEGTLVDQIRFAIIKKINSAEQEILERVEKAHAKGRNLKTSTEEALLRKLENLDGINVIGDRELADRVNRLRDLLIQHKYGEIITELSTELEGVPRT
jgi:hypothetical protein